MKKISVADLAIGLCVLWSLIGTPFVVDAQTLQLDAETKKEFLQLPQPEQFREHLTRLASTPHRAGTPANRKVADYLSQTMEAAGMTVQEYPYDIYMPLGPGKVTISLIEPVRQPLSIQEDIIPEDPYSHSPDLDIGWNAYSGSGDVTGEVVYANYGRKEDFEKLDEMGISIEGKIVLARYGGNFRGYKAYFAEKYGAAGLIIFSDPKDAGYVKGLTFPEGRYYNGSTIQRGSVLTLPYTGDPLTPFEPALPLDDPASPDRLDPDDVDLCTIPVTPIGYRAAREILERMDGQPVPGAWQGGLPFTYRLTSKSALTVRLKVNQPRGQVRIQNIVGTFTGEEFPDEWIVLGCHYDAWGYGTTDPNSGSAMLLTLAESIGKMIEQGFRPRRSILIAHWDAEEYGILGSAEWVEQLKDELSANAVAYLNADAACAGTLFSAASSPSLKPLIKAATKESPYMEGSETVWSHWKGSKKEDPAIGNLGGGSDHLGFYSHLAIPSMGGNMWSPTLYHSNYDDLYWFDRFGDSTYQNGPTLAKVLGLITLELSEQDLIPYGVGQYGIDLNGHMNKIKQRAEDQQLDSDVLKPLLAQVQTMTERGHAIDSLMRSYSSGQNQKAINHLLIQLERQFLLPEGLPFGSWYRSAYATSDPYSGYAAWMLPGLRYYIEEKDQAGLEKAVADHELVFGRFIDALEDLQEQLVR